MCGEMHVLMHVLKRRHRQCIRRLGLFHSKGRWLLHAVYRKRIFFYIAKSAKTHAPRAYPPHTLSDTSTYSISRPAYREFLRYVYTGRCGPSTEMIDGGDLYTLANMHGMVNLRDWAISLIDGRTVAAAAQFAHETEDDFLKDMCCKFVKGHFNSILYAALNGIDERVIAGFVLQAPSQVQAFKLVHGWYTANLAGFSPGDGGGLDEDVSATESLPGLLDMIDLTNIPATDIRDVVIPSGLVPNKVVMELLLSRSIELEQTLSHQSNWVNVTKELESIRTFGRRGSNSGELAHPGGIQVSSEPNCEKIVVADGANHRVQVRKRVAGVAGGCGLPDLKRTVRVALTFWELLCRCLTWRAPSNARTGRRAAAWDSCSDRVTCV